MFDRIIISIFLCLLLLCLCAYGQSDILSEKKNPNAVLLPVLQEQIDPDLRIDNEILHASVCRQLRRIPGFTMARYQQLEEAMYDSIVDYAVDELLKTNELKKTLYMLDSLEDPESNIDCLIKTAQDCRVDYIVLTRVKKEQNSLVVFWEVIQVSTEKVADANMLKSSVYDKKTIPNLLSKYLVSSFWKIQTH